MSLFDEAYGAFEKAIKLSPEEIEGKVELIKVCVMLGKHTRAKELLGLLDQKALQNGDLELDACLLALNQV